MTLRPASRRSGFTLLELLLASIIAAMLLYALYFMMNITLRQTQDARDAVEIDAVPRGAFNRIALDLSAVLGPLPPQSGGTAATADSTAATADPTTTPTATTGSGSNTPFQVGLVGSEKQFTVFVSRVPEPLTSANKMTLSRDPSSGVVPHDLRRITYWLGDSGGLCRQVRPAVTADGIWDSTDPDRSNEIGDTIVDEVKDVTFEYLYIDTSGNTTWQSTWESTQMDPDGTGMPLGPPRAVRVTLVMKFPTGPNSPTIDKTAVHVIPIRTAPGLITPTLIDPATDTGTGTTDTTGSGTTGTGTTGTGTTGTSGSTGGNTGGATGGGGTTTGGATGGGTGGGTMSGTGGGGGAKTGGGGK